MVRPALALVSLGALVGCQSVEDRPAEWAYIHAAILQPNCATAACHSALLQQSGLDLSTRDAAYESLLRRPCGSTAEPMHERGVNVDPGHPETSPLMTWLRGEYNLRMPPDVPLPPAEIAAIERWILEGAPCE